jgi:nitrite reductase/ring-hydroxylating ferredoxin subunit
VAEVICRFDELEDLQCREFRFRQGEEKVEAFLLRIGDEVVAYRNNCPHTGAPLNWKPDDFLSFNRDFIECAIHGALFRLNDGYCLHGPCNGRSLQSVPICIEAGVISIKEE